MKLYGDIKVASVSRQFVEDVEHDPRKLRRLRICKLASRRGHCIERVGAKNLHRSIEVVSQSVLKCTEGFARGMPRAVAPIASNAFDLMTEKAPSEPTAFHVDDMVEKLCG